MTDSFVTQCPHCQTSFRVTHHQLSVARGVVRCGQCLQVFNAAKQLLAQNRSAPPQANPLPATEAAPSPAAPTPAPGHPIAPADEAGGPTAQALDELDLDQELERHEPRHAGLHVRLGHQTHPRRARLAR
ncbi:MJ0042-type zinc finger domain-containing protein, partial [Pseudomonas parafulva]